MFLDRGIRRGVVGLVVVAAWLLPSVAQAKRKYRVTIESEPSDAEVYLDTEESDPLGTTPLKRRLESGTYTVILRKDGYITGYEQIQVKRGKNKFTIELEKLEGGKVKVIAPDGQAEELSGATVLIDGEEVGELGETFEVDIGAYAIKVEKQGFESFEQYVEIDAGGDQTITADLTRMSAPGDNKDPFAGKKKVEKKASPRAGGPPPMVVVGAGLEFGGRVFRYLDDQGCTLCRTYDAHGVARFRITGEVYPLVVLDNPLLDGFGITGSFGRATPLPSKTSDGMDVDTTWFDFDVGVRYQYKLSPDLMIGAGVGFSQETFTFEQGALFEQVPVVEYKRVRMSVDGRMRLHEYVSGFAGAQYMLVSELGDELRRRFPQGDTAFGFGAKVGGLGHIVEGFDVRVEAAYNQFVHDYAPSTEYPAGGGKDHYWLVLLGGAYTY